jgi:transposase-like protein
MARKQRKNYSAEEKVAILKLHLLEQKPISDICDQYNLQPTVFYRWQKEFFENAPLAFKKNKDKTTRRFEKKIKDLEDKLSRKNEVLSELMEEHIALKKNIGDL